MGLFNIGISGMLASQYQLAITGQNITNSGVDGYNRKNAILEENTPGNRFNGVQIQGTRSIVDQFVDRELRNNVAAFSRMETYFSQATQLDQMFSDEDTSLINNLNAFFANVENVNADPASVQSREMLLNDTNRLCDQFNSVSNNVNDQYNVVNFQLESYAEAITSISSDIAKINTQLKGGIKNFALEEKRENLLKDLSEYVGIQTVKKSDNTIDVSINTGQNLVLNGDSAELVTLPDPTDQNRFELAIRTDGSDMIISSKLDGGKVGGALAYRNEILDQARNELGRLALTLSDEVNKQNKMGLTLKNTLGEAIFKEINDPSDMQKRVIRSDNNVGTASMSVAIDDAQQLKTTDYRFVMTSGTDYALLRMDNNQQVASGTVGALPAQVSVDGFTLNIDSGSLSSGDTYRIMPTRLGSNTIESAISDVKDFAIASPILTGANQNNAGSGQISAGTISDINNASFATQGALSPPIRIEFLSSTSYQLVNDTTSAVLEGPIAYDPAIDNEIFPTPGSYDPGYRVTLNGNAVSGDSFNIDYNAGGYNDNRNGLLISNIQDRKLVENNSQNLREAFSAMTGTISSKTNSAETGMTISKAILSSTQTQRNQISGVNDDEEAANLIRFQQSFQASAQVIAVAKSMFETLFSMID